MKKIALSLVVLAASAAFVWQYAPTAQSTDPLDSTMLTGASGDGLPGLAVGDGPPAAQLPGPQVAKPPSSVGTSETAPIPASHLLPKQTVTQQQALSPIAEALPRKRPKPPLPLVTIDPASMVLIANAGFVDGVYTGPVTDAYYGPMQIQATIKGGQLTGIKVLQWPNDRRTSVRINQQAIPMLRDEVVQAQSANVDIITGATLTSDAFIKSMKGALQQAQAH